MAVSVEVIKQLRNMTLASVADCKRALDEANGDLKTATELIRKRGLEIAAKKASRAVHQGRIEAYVHTGSKIGVLLEVNSETDFVARNEDFARFTKDVAMHIAATDPKYLRSEDVPADDVAKLDEKGQKDYAKAHCLLSQAFVKDDKLTIADLLTQMIAKLGENIVIRRFARFKVGE